MADKYFKGSFSQLYGYGYYAFVDNNGRLVIGEERGREGGELYRGEYKGENTPWLSDIKKENVRLYNSIVKYFNEHTNEHKPSTKGWIKTEVRVYYEASPRECSTEYKMVDSLMCPHCKKKFYPVTEDIANANHCLNCGKALKE